MELIYPFEVAPLAEEDGGGWLVTFPDLPGCMADGETSGEAIEQAKDALESYIKTAQEFGDPLPEPRPLSMPNMPSGRCNLRLPKSLHAALTAGARVNGVSTNAFAVALLAGGLGWKPAKPVKSGGAG